MGLDRAYDMMNHARSFLLWRPHGGHPARVMVGPHRGTFGIVKQMRHKWRGSVVLESAGAEEDSPPTWLTVSAWRLGPIRESERIALPPQRGFPSTKRPRPLFSPRDRR